MVESDQAAEVASLDNALNNPDFTSVFAPIDPQASRKKMAKQAGVEPVILMEHVTKIYPAQPNKPALDDINIEIYPGEFVFLVGHSGSGKTTLLSTLNRDVKPTSGRILVAGQDLMKIKNRKVPFLRRQIGAVFQDFKLLPQKTAYENVAFALQCIGKPKGVIRSQVPRCCVWSVWPIRWTRCPTSFPVASSSALPSPAYGQPSAAADLRRAHG